jgi:putative peptide zinc metalloprotease protein
MIPTPLQLSGSLVLISDARSPVYAQIPGRVERYYVHDGDIVEEGQILADLSNRDKLRERDRIQNQISINRAKYDLLFSSHKPGDRDNAKIFATLADELEPALTKLTEQIGSLKLQAPRAGVVQGLLHHESEGRWVNPAEGKPLCEIVDPRQLRAIMVLDQADVDLVKEQKNPRAWIKVYGTGSRTVVSEVVAVARRNLEDLPPELSNVIGGEIPAKPDPKTGVMKPLSAVYEVAIPVDNSDLRLQPGLRGRGRIDAGYASFGWWLWRNATKTFHFTL